MLGVYSVSGIVSDALKQKKYKQTQFAAEINVSPSFLSRVLKGEKPIPISILDKAIAALGLDERECYELYLNEWKNQKRSSRTIEEFLVYCIENDKKEYADLALAMLLEMGGYLPVVYGAGEKLFKKGMRAEALGFFDEIISHESDKKSSLLAMASYRKLLTFYDTDTEKSEETALQLCEHLDYVHEEEILEAHYKVIATFRLKRKWDYVIRYGEKLVRLAKVKQKMEYVGDALIRMSIAAREKEDYELSLRYIDEYGSLPIEHYQFAARANRLVTLITAGDNGKIIELFYLAVENKERSFEIMEFLLESLVKNEMMDLIEQFFREFPEQIKQLEDLEGRHSIYDRHLINFLYAKALYDIKKGKNSWIDLALRSAEIAAKLRLDKQAIQSVRLVLENREITTTEQYQRCLKLLDCLAS
ncbi:helix-turn-helix domain-containing protein [Brevibacillus borstelensis]|uniref:helix-turn-helix domain-containing protein n=1 Tax=Brevibacillus borstelensis TaxID=45462 RepID=UPI0004F3B751|nr:helix-turn-helix transcriptional regulator [Brevibacillus borstelensis]KKX53276.1 hypothetical protein X546_20590 [Brevibacillus borstelensis cifa_chp40]